MLKGLHAKIAEHGMINYSYTVKKILKIKTVFTNRLRKLEQINTLTYNKN